MTISHAIVHGLRAGPDTDTQLTLREAELPGEEPAEPLFEALKGAFLGRISREHGSFSTEGDTAPLPRELAAFASGERPFADVTASLMKGLADALGEKPAPIDLHAFFFVERSAVRHLFYWFMAPQRAALAVNGDLEVVTQYAIDTGPALFGIKVDLGEWKERQHYSYLTLLPPRGNPPLTEAFQQLTGFANGLDKAEATLAFLEGVESFAKSVPPEQVQDYRTQVVEYCLEREEQDAPVDLKALAGSLEGVDRDAFVRVVGGGNEPDRGLMMDRRSLRRYVKFSGRERDLAVSFGSHQLDSRVQYDAENDTLRIHGLPSALRKQLLEHIKGA